MRRSGTTHSSGMLRGALLCALLLLLDAGAAGAEELDSEEELSPRALRDFYPKGPNLTSEKQLLGALHEVLEKLQAKRLPSWEKKFGQVPMCDVGEQCAVRKGARIGKMCDCPRGAFCNFFLLKCL
ncbi:cocaine- and amphetamine-regulated transcript protein-like [Brachionichthys hirsutus]|uniref:cocaine- and amphetamine-regulated transcript protein-like n=1 Tax=Brachionichthys hirsutus TaxID=412623 RepID=UPI0036053710